MSLGYDTLRAIPRRDRCTIEINRIAGAILAKAKGYLSKDYRKTTQTVGTHRNYLAVLLALLATAALSALLSEEQLAMLEGNE
jgi:hypothetical protein